MLACMCTQGLALWETQPIKRWFYNLVFPCLAEPAYNANFQREKDCPILHDSSADKGPSSTGSHQFLCLCFGFCGPNQTILHWSDPSLHQSVEIRSVVYGAIHVLPCSFAAKHKNVVSLMYCLCYGLVNMHREFQARLQALGTQHGPETIKERYTQNGQYAPPKNTSCNPGPTAWCPFAGMISLKPDHSQLTHCQLCLLQPTVCPWLQTWCCHQSPSQLPSGPCLCPCDKNDVSKGWSQAQEQLQTAPHHETRSLHGWMRCGADGMACLSGMQPSAMSRSLGSAAMNRFG